MGAITGAWAGAWVWVGAWACAACTEAGAVVAGGFEVGIGVRDVALAGIAVTGTELDVGAGLGVATPSSVLTFGAELV